MTAEENANPEWFKDWFNSPYYHLLYNKRDQSEAKAFITKLLNFLNPKAGSYMLDIACGKGRHAKFLAEKGFQVTGIDLSEQNIEAANKYAQSNLQFFVHDMRKLFYTNYFHYAFNFFTSFGYFERESDNIKTLGALNKSLKTKGQLTIDFLNVHKTIKNLKPSDVIQSGGIDFHVERKEKNGFIIKNIHFEDNGKSYHFQEKVQALTLDDFKRYFEKTHFSIQHIFGNYALDDFDIDSSDRLILIVEKNA